MALTATSTTSPTSTEAPSRRIFGTGEMAGLVRAFDWSNTPLGPIDAWPESLLTTVNILLGSRHPLVLWWGEELIQFYNDAYRPSLGREKHPKALGQRAQDCWPEVWESLEPQVRSVLHQGEATWNVDQYLPIYRNGDQLEDAWWTFSYSPVRDSSGNIAGIFIVVSETTPRVRTERALSSSRERLQLALEAANLGTWSYNPQDETFTADAAMQRIFGAPEPTGDHDFWQKLLHPEDRLAAREEFAAALAGRRPYNLEYRVLHPDGVRWIRSKGNVLGAGGETKSMFAIVEDITEAKLAEIELHASARDFREAQRIGKMGSWRLVLATGELVWSEEVYRLMDHDPNLPVLNFALHPEIIEEDSNRRLVAAIEQCIATGRAYEVDVKMFLPGSGRVVWLATRGEPVFSPEGNVIELSGTVRDITDRKLAEESLRASEERLQLALAAANLGTWSYDSETGISTGDPAMQRIFGSARASGDFAYWIEFSHPDDREAIGADFVAALSGDGAYQTEYRIVRPPDGDVRWIRSVGRVLREPDRPLQMLVVVEDITERKLAEDALRSSEERLQLALETARLGTWSYDAATDISTGDATMQRIFGSSRASGDFSYWIQFVHPDDREAVGSDFQAATSGDVAYESEYRIVRPYDGEVRWIRSRGRTLREPDRPLRMAVIVEDITDRKLAEQALLRTEKLAAVGRLASSIAHEINNPLESITNLLYLARASDEIAQTREYLDLADSELRRASAITSQTLRFHKQSTRPLEVTWDDLTSNALAVLRSRILNAKVTVEKRNSAKRPVLCFDGEIRQVVSNLLINAIDAMPPQGGRLLLRGREGHDHATGRPGLILTIADTASGMSRDTLARIFEPFYTTKGVGGTGLGLWISKEIVDRHRGLLHVRSSQRPGRTGTVFTLFLPFLAATR